VIPADRLNPIGSKLASYSPVPNQAKNYYGQTNFNVTAPQYDRADQLDFKLDQEITSRLRAAVSYLHYGSREPSYAYWGNIASPGQSTLVRHVDATQANTTFTATPTTVVALRWGFNRYPNTTYSYNKGFGLAGLGFPQSLIGNLQLAPSQLLRPVDHDGTGASLASLLLGFSSSGSVVTSQSLANMIRSAVFVQDLCA
jgi:hypothetical protein